MWLHATHCLYMFYTCMIMCVLCRHVCQSRCAHRWMGCWSQWLSSKWLWRPRETWRSRLQLWWYASRWTWGWVELSGLYYTHTCVICLNACLYTRVVAFIMYTDSQSSAGYDTGACQGNSSTDMHTEDGLQADRGMCACVLSENNVIHWWHACMYFMQYSNTQWQAGHDTGVCHGHGCSTRHTEDGSEDHGGEHAYVQSWQMEVHASVCESVCMHATKNT